LILTVACVLAVAKEVNGNVRSVAVQQEIVRAFCEIGRHVTTRFWHRTCNAFFFGVRRFVVADATENATV